MRREDTPQPHRAEFADLVTRLSKFRSETEYVPLARCVGRVLAEDVFSINTLPNRPVSRMDGIAFRYADFVGCGGDCSGWVENRDFVFSNTGVAVPQEYDTVVLIEEVEFDDTGAPVILKPPASAGENLSPPGGRLHRGQRLLRRYERITPSHLGLLASGGILSVPVVRKPRVGVIPTGDELISPDVPLQPGRNVETNSLVLRAMIEEWGGEAVVWPIIPDEFEFLVSVVRQALELCDMVILNAGSSKGRKDYAGDVLSTVGEVYVYEVGHGPGKHTSFTLAGGKPIVGLVGPTGGAELTALWYVQPLVCKYLHQPVLPPERVRVTLMADTHSPVTFDFYLSLTVYRDTDGILRAWPMAPHAGTRHLASAPVANAVLCLPDGQNYCAGEQVEVELKIPSASLPPVEARD